jgi:hypothetical protein
MGPVGGVPRVTRPLLPNPRLLPSTTHPSLIPRSSATRGSAEEAGGGGRSPGLEAVQRRRGTKLGGGRGWEVGGDEDQDPGWHVSSRRPLGFAHDWRHGMAASARKIDKGESDKAGGGRRAARLGQQGWVRRPAAREKGRQMLVSW